MHIQLNGDSFELADNISLTNLIDQLDLQGKRLAIEVNGELVPRSGHADYQLQPKDKVEIVQAIGGG